MKYYLHCRGCGFQVQVTPANLKRAVEHEEKDVCRRKGDRESAGWDLDEGLV